MAKSPQKPFHCDGKLASFQLPVGDGSTTKAAKPTTFSRQPGPPSPCPLGAAIFSEPVWREISRSLGLSGQELQVVRGIFDDHTEAAIADHLKVSPHTIHTHCERLYRKLGVGGRVRLTLRVMNEYIALSLAPETSLPPLCAHFATGHCPLRTV
jgi:DNA-binding CsgD family transcriptional regulator